MPNQNQNNANRPGRTRPQHESEIVSEMGKLQPQDLPMEEAVLGALMLEKDAYSAVSDLLKPQAFYDPSHQKIYEAIQTLGSMQRPIDMLTVTEQLRANGTLAEVGGPVRISELTGRVSSAANIEFHARIILQKYISRQLIAFSSMVQTKAFDETLDVYDLMQEAEGTLFEISKSTLKRDVVQIDPIISEAIKKIQDAANNESGLSGLQTGYYALDKITGGWQNSDLIIIAARPAMGKTALVL
ncbi:MAG: replicative DNA helicase, partial [Muribaculaceae bacterium]|nr:replicative DNA helicase [Muribaculaceae bacterium]